ncbi:MAG: hypothetical protein AAGE37_11360 [Pseudomonadota bacterium]
MTSVLLFVAAGIIAIVALYHSFAGQRVLVGPLLSERTEITADPTFRAIILFGWHSTTALMLLAALYLVLVASGLAASNVIQIAAIGLTFVGLGIANAIMAKFQHPGWIMLSSIGLITLSSLIV